MSLTTIDWIIMLVYSLTERPKEGHLAWHKRPAALGVFVLMLTVLLNIIFW